MRRPLPTIWVLGDQLNTSITSLEGRKPGECRVLLVESTSKLASKPWHRQRLHLVVSAMAHFAAELEAAGYDVDHRRAPTLTAGLRAHRQEHAVDEVVVMEPMNWNGRALLDRLNRRFAAENQLAISIKPPGPYLR